MLNNEIDAAQRLVRTDAYQMSLGEIVNMYEAEEIIIHPEFQRLFRWNSSQKSKLIESLLLGIPLPSIFVFEKDDGKWELIDGLQRLSTILEFMGVLKTPEGEGRLPSVLEATKYLPSLHNIVWNPTNGASDLPLSEQVPLDKVQKLAIRRARISVEILKRPSGNQTKFDLFQRLNAGGTQANAQELRNCVMLMVSDLAFRLVKTVAESESFKAVTAVSEDQIEKQRHMEFAVRFLVHANTKYDGVLDVEEYVDDGIIQLFNANKVGEIVEVMQETFDLLEQAIGSDALRRYEGGRHTGKVGLVGLEGVAVGVGRNLNAIKSLPDPRRFVLEKAQSFWAQPQAGNLTSPGLRGTVRLQRTIPFGEVWFRP